MMKTLYLDFETQSRLSLRKVGAYRYARDESTKPICAGWALVDHRFQLEGPEQRGILLYARPDALGAGLDLTANNIGPDMTYFSVLAADPDVRLVAHNAEFERLILLHRYGVDVPLSRISCTAARAARLSLPRSLEGICIALGLDEEKDKDGHRVLMKLTRPRRPSKDDRSEFWTEERKPEDYAAVYDYCIQDVRAMMAVDLQLPELPATEREVWETTIEMNQRGVAVDLPAVQKAQALAELEKGHIAREFRDLVGCSPASPDAAKLLGMRDLQKATVRDVLKRSDVPDATRTALELRQQYARSSVYKLNAFANRIEPDGRVRGSLVYSGAERTQRWSGAGIQPQNFPRGMGKRTDDAFAHLENGSLDLVHDDVLKAISEMLRGFITGPLLVGDYSQVEARVLAWLAGETALLELFRSGGDPYCALASEVFARSITKANEKERFMGKQGVLGCGYQIGPDKFRATLDKQHDVQVSEDFAKKVVSTYRQKFRRIVTFWGRMERAFIYVLKEGKTRIRASNEDLPPIFMGTMTVHGRPFAYIELPSGRCLYYAYPELVERNGSRSNEVQAQYLGRSSYTHQWEYVTTYGGKLTENIVQALSRDLLADAMLRLRAAGFPLVLTVHDEVVSEDREPVEGYSAEVIFMREMNKIPGWAVGLPLIAECFQCNRYRK